MLHPVSIGRYGGEVEFGEIGWAIVYGQVKTCQGKQIASVDYHQEELTKLFGNSNSRLRGEHA